MKIMQFLPLFRTRLCTVLQFYLTNSFLLPKEQNCMNTINKLQSVLPNVSINKKNFDLYKRTIQNTYMFFNETFSDFQQKKLFMKKGNFGKIIFLLTKAFLQKTTFIKMEILVENVKLSLVYKNAPLWVFYVP